MNRETSGVVVSDVVLIFTWLDFRNLEVFLVIECETKLETETKPRECFDWPMITVATFAKDETNFIMDAFLWAAFYRGKKDFNVLFLILICKKTISVLTYLLWLK